jgi:long-chain acyl-CoA synthetase
MRSIGRSRRHSFLQGMVGRGASMPASIPQMVSDSARRFRSKVVFQVKRGDGFATITYEELGRRAREFAAGLVAMGLQPGDRMAIICDNGFPWIIGYLGLVTAGGVGVPLYTELKGPEMGGLLRRAGAKVVLASPRVLNKLEDRLGGVEKVIVADGEALEKQKLDAGGFWLWRQTAEVVSFSDVAGRATEESHRELDSREVKSDDLASIVFTSGTTGGMKGVMLTHGNFLANVDSMRAAVPVSERDSMLLVLPLHHAFPFTVGILALISIGAMVTIENDLLRIRDRMMEVRPTVFVGVPALYELMLRAILARLDAEGRREQFERGLRLVEAVKRRTGVNIGRRVFGELHKRLGGRLRFMISGGAALNPETARAYFLLGIPLIQGWGLTETAPVCVAQPFSSRRFTFTDYYERHVGSVGVPVKHVEVDLIDVPEKEIYVALHNEGELVVRGPNVTPGYWQDENATRAARVGEWFRTGDVGRIDEEGNVYITGRSKYVIVLDSGEKVHPDEVEETLQRSELIEDVAIVGRKVKDKTQVSAVIYPNYVSAAQRCRDEGKEVDGEAVKAMVTEEVRRQEEELAAYKRVVEIMLTDRPLPKNALRKVSREELADEYSFDVKTWMDGVGQAQ